MWERSRFMLTPFLWGACGVLTVLLVASLLWATTVLWVRASHGQDAYQYLIQVQQQQASKMTPPK